MGRNQASKKKQRQEKAKTKLKQSKTQFLPKGLNVTNTTFKVRSIVLPEQLKEKNLDAPLSKRKLNVADLLSRVKHYNENIRHGACEELAQMIQIYPDEIVNQHLSPIILALCPLMQDRESKVRKSLVKVINNLFAVTPVEKIDVFFQIVSSYLRCAMTNIDKNIQEDSLLFLDALLKYFPNLLAKNSDRILPDFITLISKLRTDTTLVRTLTINLGSKITTVKWRIKVLSRLYGILEAILFHKKKPTDDGSVKSVMGDLNVVVPDKASYNIPIYKDTSALVNSSSNFLEATNQQNSKETMLYQHITTLVPLLYESWMEVLPEKGFTSKGTEATCINEEAATILRCILKIMHMLWQYIKSNNKDNNNEAIKSVFLTDEGKKFFAHILENFPYVQIPNKNKQGKSKADKKLLDVNDDPKCVEENLLICYLFSVVYSSDFKHRGSERYSFITAYISRCLLSKNYINPSNIKYLLLVLKSVLNENPKFWKSKGSSTLEDLLGDLIIFYNNTHHLGKYKVEIIHILAEIHQGNNIKMTSNYEVWLSTLPNLLCQKQISEDTANILLHFAKMGYSIFEKSFLNKLSMILDNLLKLQIVDTTDEERVKRNIVSILFYFKVLRRENLDDISVFIKENPNCVFVKYFINMLELRNDMKYYKTFEDLLNEYVWWQNR